MMALMLFFARPLAAAMPLTETICTIPEGEFELLAGAYLVRTGELYRGERLAIGFGVLDDLSVWFTTGYIHRETGGDDSGMGDSFLKIWYYLGDAAANRLHAGLAAIARIPTGPSAYDSSRWHNISLGVNELSLGTALQYEMGRFFFHGSAFYVFRQGQGEDFYGGFSGNVTEKDTWIAAFGLNPWREETFLEGGRLANDYVSASLAVNTVILDRLVPFAEVYASHRVHRRETDNDRLPLEGAGVNPVLAGAGCRYFAGGGYLELFALASLVRKSGYIREIAGVSAGLMF